MQVSDYPLEMICRGIQMLCVVLGVCWVWVDHRKRLRNESEASEGIIVDATNDDEYDPIFIIPTIEIPTADERVFLYWDDFNGVFHEYILYDSNIESVYIGDWIFLGEL